MEVESSDNDDEQIINDNSGMPVHSNDDDW